MPRSQVKETVVIPRDTRRTPAPDLARRPPSRELPHDLLLASAKRLSLPLSALTNEKRAVDRPKVFARATLLGIGAFWMLPEPWSGWFGPGQEHPGTLPP